MEVTTGGDSGSLIEEAARLAAAARELQDSAAALIARTSNEEQALRQRALALESDLRRLSSGVRNGHLDPQTAEKLDEEVGRVRCLVADGDVGSLLPSKSHGCFLKMFLGPVSVRVPRKEVQLKLKEEYNSKRDRTASLFLILPSILLFLRYWIWDECFPAWPVQLYQAWLLFLYIGLALRENILRVNGSDIRPWWIYHHYCAMLTALVSLTWEIKGQPDCAYKQGGVLLFLKWAIMQGVSMLLQNRYQRQKLYTRIALGKAKRMDVVWGETAGVEGQLELLFPVLFFLQGFELYIGISLLWSRTAWVGASEWQLIVCGVLLVVMALGNIVETLEAYMKRSKSKQDSDHHPLTSPTKSS